MKILNFSLNNYQETDTVEVGKKYKKRNDKIYMKIVKLRRDNEREEMHRMQMEGTYGRKKMLFMWRKAFWRTMRGVWS